jgi:hypothetical protein
MHSLLKKLSLVLAAGIPGTLLAQFAGASLPAPISPGNLFVAFVFILTLLTVVADYTRRGRAPLPRRSPANVLPAHARTERHQLAA